MEAVADSCERNKVLVQRGQKSRLKSEGGGSRVEDGGSRVEGREGREGGREWRVGV